MLIVELAVTAITAAVFAGLDAYPFKPS